MQPTKTTLLSLVEPGSTPPQLDITALLEQQGFDCRRVGDQQAALDFLSQNDCGLVLACPAGQRSALSWLKAARQHCPDVAVVLVYPGAGIEDAVELMQAGASDLLTEVGAPAQLMQRLGRFVRYSQQGPSMIAQDLRSIEVVELARKVAQSDVTIMIHGESGTGKEVLARYIHVTSPRRDAPFVAMNCAAIPENMLEAMLFGYEKGAFTGAYQAMPGKFEQAEGGTLLLDEISEMSLELQAKLLRVLQEKEVERLGGRRVVALDVRVLATTNRKLREEVAAGRFREDLFYRLNVFPLHLPPLRERPRDIVPLAEYLIRKHTAPAQPVPDLDDDSRAHLLAHTWPGNVRELENVVQRALILCQDSVIQPGDLQLDGDDLGAVSLPAERLADEAMTLNQDMRSIEEQKIMRALRSAGGNRKQVSRQLGISERTLRYKLARMREAGMEIPR